MEVLSREPLQNQCATQAFGVTKDSIDFFSLIEYTPNSPTHKGLPLHLPAVCQLGVLAGIW